MAAVALRLSYRLGEKGTPQGFRAHDSSMYTFFWLTGIVVWIFVGLIMVARVRRLPAIQKWLWGPSFYPYRMYLRYKTWGWMLSLKRNKRVAPEVVTALRTNDLRAMRELRDTLVEVDRLPTVEKGKKALGLSSIFEMSYRSVSGIESPYTHPLQNPPYFLPGVPSESFSDPARLEWVPPLEEAYPVIREELMKLLDDDGAGFNTYVDEYQNTLTGWNTFNFFFYGKKVEDNCALCPETTKVLDASLWTTIQVI